MDEKEMWSIGEASKFLGVSENTMRRWDLKGILKACKTDGGHRRYNPEDIREFLKTSHASQPETNLVDEFVRSDVRVKENQLEKDLKFWEGKGFISDDMDSREKGVLATILSNQLEVMGVNNQDVDEEFILDILHKTWTHLTSRKFIHFNAMWGPTCLHYTTVHRSGNVCVDSDPVVAVTSKMQTKLNLPRLREEETITVLDPQTFVPKQAKRLNGKPWSVDLSWLADWNGRQLANEINNEIVNDLWEEASQEDFPQDKLGIHCHVYNTVIANELGLRLLKEQYGAEILDVSLGMDTKMVGSVYGSNVFYNPTINGVMLLNKGSTYMNTVYTYYFYVPITLTPSTLTEEGVVTTGCITRCAKVHKSSNVFDRLPCKFVF